MYKTFAVAEVKSATSDDPNGAFEVVLSAETLDRDGEVIVEGAFVPLPESIPFHAFHDFKNPVARAVPYYEDGVLKAKGVFASTPRAQEVRTLVTEGIIGHTSVGFMAAQRADVDGKAHITSAELLEGSFVSVPSNREAAVLMAKAYDAKSGARNSTKDAQRLQSIHDLAVENGAKCQQDAGDDSSTDAPESPADEAGKAPASGVVEAARAIAAASRVLSRLA